MLLIWCCAALGSALDMFMDDISLGKTATLNVENTFLTNTFSLEPYGLFFFCRAKTEDNLLKTVLSLSSCALLLANAKHLHTVIYSELIQ